MRYKLVAKYIHQYEDEYHKIVRYSLLIEANGLRFIDCTATLFMAAKVGQEVSIPSLPSGTFMVDLTEPSIPDIL